MSPANYTAGVHTCVSAVYTRSMVSESERQPVSEVKMAAVKVEGWRRRGQLGKRGGRQPSSEASRQGGHRAIITQVAADKQRLFRAFGTRNTHEFADVVHYVPSMGAWNILFLSLSLFSSFLSFSIYLFIFISFLSDQFLFCFYLPTLLLEHFNVRGVDGGSRSTPHNPTISVAYTPKQKFIYELPFRPFSMFYTVRWF